MQQGSVRGRDRLLPVREGSEWLDDVLMHSPRWMRGGRSRRRFGLNRFGRYAMAAWQEAAPAALARITDPRMYFSELGERAESQWASLWPQMLEPDAPGEDFFSKAGRVEAAKMRAEEMIRAELLTPPVEEQDVDEPEPDPLAEVRQAWRDLMDEGE